MELQHLAEKSKNGAIILGRRLRGRMFRAVRLWKVALQQLADETGLIIQNASTLRPRTRRSIALAWPQETQVGIERVVR